MFPQLLMLLLSAKSLLGLTAAYEIASAGRLVEAVTLGFFAVTPSIWCVVKQAVAWPLTDDFN